MSVLRNTKIRPERQLAGNRANDRNWPTTAKVDDFSIGGDQPEVRTCAHDPHQARMFLDCRRSAEKLVQVATIPACRWVGDNQELDGLLVRVLELVRFAGRNVNTFPCAKRVFPTFQFHDGLAGNNEKELLRSGVKVTFFRLARWNRFSNHVKIRVFEKMPTVTAVAPDIMLRVLCGNFAHRLSAEASQELFDRAGGVESRRMFPLCCE